MNGAANGTNGVAKLTLRPGEVHAIALTQTDGRFAPTKFANKGGKDQIMFTLVDGRKLYVDPYVQERINALGVAPGTQFEIELVETVNGNFRTCSVEVRGIGQRYALPVSATGGLGRPPVTPAFRQEERTTHPPTFIAPAPPPAPQLPPILVNGQGQSHVDILLGCYADAIKVALRVVDMARESGLHISPDFEDVRTIATTLCIPKVGR